MSATATIIRGKPAPASKFIKELGLPMNNKTFEQGLILCGDLESAEYVSSTGSGEIKTFLRLTQTGLALGQNAYSPFSPHRTDAVFFPSSFTIAYARAAAAIAKHADELARATFTASD